MKEEASTSTSTSPSLSIVVVVSGWCFVYPSTAAVQFGASDRRMRGFRAKKKLPRGSKATKWKDRIDHDKTSLVVAPRSSLYPPAQTR